MCDRRTAPGFMNCYRSNYRRILQQEVLQDLQKFSQLPDYDKEFVLKICIHKIREGKV